MSSGAVALKANNFKAPAPTRVAASRPMSAKVIALATRSPYQEPTVAVFPIDGISMTGPLTMAGNV